MNTPSATQPGPRVITKLVVAWEAVMSILMMLSAALSLLVLPTSIKDGMANLQKATQQLQTALDAIQASWKRQVAAKEAMTEKYHLMAEVAARLLTALVMMQGTDLTTAYEIAYALIRPRVSCRPLTEDEKVMLQRVFGTCSGEEIDVEGLEKQFLMDHRDYQGGYKVRRDVEASVERVILPRMVASLPDEFAQNADLQQRVRTQIEWCMASIETQFTLAGIDCLTETQAASIVAGSILQNCFTEKPFGGGL